jgi:C-terminal processing protease CtpA/Prc
MGAPRYVDKPVYILINQYTFSGGEQFAYDLKALHRATLIGQTTGGGANPGGDVWLNDHFSVFIPRGTAVNPYTGTNWEGTGVVPDIALDPETGKAFIEAYTLALKSAKDSFPAAVEDRNFALKDPGKALELPFPYVLPHE